MTAEQWLKRAHRITGGEAADRPWRKEKSDSPCFDLIGRPAVGWDIPDINVLGDLEHAYLTEADAELILFAVNNLGTLIALVDAGKKLRKEVKDESAASAAWDSAVAMLAEVNANE